MHRGISIYDESNDMLVQVTDPKRMTTGMQREVRVYN